ncbi:flagellar biosynthetic protein FliQ [Mesorhizobium sp. SP-1A]|uniref:flagellar biosynthetic protein FliQ n=1 Tax=Mesorhizobium sp. SP-1A TaxID=3077840 RepID=UPI0028F74CEC|nr:flagellar biosynthetic protein FliQ [Mesorhizobium sp. SP-1A]
MNEADVVQVLSDGLWTALIAAAPVMGVAVAVGLTIALFQALTSIQEMTLTFVPKVAAIIVATIMSLPFIFQSLSSLMDRMIDAILGL